MALGTPSESPAVVVKEIDLTGGVPNVQSTTGAIVGDFRWGPAEERVLISNEAGLVETFASPSTSTSIDFHNATQYLRYSSTLQVVRAVHDSATNAIGLSNQDSIGSVVGIDPVTIKNDAVYDENPGTYEGIVDSNGTVNALVIARYPGSLGASLRFEAMAQLDGADSAVATWSGWKHKGNFDKIPDTTEYAEKYGAQNDEIHAVVVDRNGLFTGTRNTVLETFTGSVIKGAKRGDGTNIYIKDVINKNSKYVRLINFPGKLDSAGAGDTITNEKDYAVNYSLVREEIQGVSLTNGGDGGTLDVGDYRTGYALFEDKDQVEIDFLIAPSMSSRTDQVTLVNDLVSTAGSTRKDCVVTASPARSDIVGVTADADKVTNAVTTAASYTNSSYLVVDNNFLKVYDKYNDQYIQIPASSTVAGIMAATDFNRAPWFSPAGGRRGQLFGVTALNYSPTKSQRDTLYKAGINPIANVPGQGTVLFGDKTFLNRVSAFDRINVRRLFLVLERAISRAAENVLFEFNDEFTRAEFVNIVEPVLREIKGRRGITDFRVVADETNNTPAVVDRNEFIASIFIKPARSINYITLNFVAVRTGVDFEEVVGTV